MALVGHLERDTVEDVIGYDLDEISGSANTEELARKIREKFPKAKVVCYPDPTGKRRQTSATIGRTDFSILKEAGFTVLARTASPPIVDSVAAVNRKLLNANGDIEMLFSPQVPNTIRSMERTAWLESRPESAMIDKTQNVEHFSDGIRYMTEYLYSIAVSQARQSFGAKGNFQF